MTYSSYIYFVQAKVKALHAASEVQFDGEEQLSSLYIFLCVAFFTVAIDLLVDIMKR